MGTDLVITWQGDSSPMPAAILSHSDQGNQYGSQAIRQRGYTTLQEAKRNIGYYLIDYHWLRPHQHNEGIPPATADNRPDPVSAFI